MKMHLLATSALGAALLGSPTFAQTSTAPVAAPDSGQISEVIVTAQRRAESLSHVGETVTAVGAADLARQGVTSPQDLTRDVPGLQATASYGGNPVYTLRGVGFSTQNVNATAPIGLYMDEAALPYPYMSNGLLFDLQRVEVLKGPQGTLYGRNATGGLVDFVTAKPTNHFTAGATLDAGNYGTINGEGYVSGPVTDWLKLRLAVASDNRFDGWQKSVTRDESLGRLHRNAVRLTADIDNGGPLTAEVTASYWRQIGDSQAPQAIDYRFAGSPFANPLSEASIIAHPTSDTQADWLSGSRQPEAGVGIIHQKPIIDSDFASITTKLQYNLSSNIKLVSLTSYDYLHHHDVDDASGLQTESVYLDNAGNIGSVSQELRAIGDYGKLTWSAGGYYAYDYTTETDVGYVTENAQINELRYFATLFNSHGYTPFQIANSFGNFLDTAKTDTTVAAIFANADYKFNDLIKLTVGGRYTEDRTKFQGCTYDYQGHNVPVINNDYPLFTGGATFNLQPGQCYTLNASENAFVPDVNAKQDQDNFAWRAVLDVTPAPNTLLYGSVSRGYKAGGFPVVAASAVSQFAPVKQEELTAYEAGAKLGLFDHRVQVNGAFFYYDYLNKQAYGYVQDVIFSTLQRIENIPKSREYGFEGDATWRISPYLTATAAGVYLDSKIEKYIGYNDLGNITNFAGNPYAYTPKFQGNAALVYDAPITDRLNLDASVDGTYQTDSHGDFAGLSLFKIKPYGLVDATLGVADPSQGWHASLYMKNLFDKYYWVGLGTATESVFRYAGMPRTYGLRLSYKY